MLTYEIRVEYADGSHEVARINSSEECCCIPAAVGLAVDARRAEGALYGSLLCIIDREPQQPLAVRLASS